MSIQLVKIENPFDRTRRKEEVISFDANNLKAIIEAAIPEGVKVCVSVNGQIVPFESWEYYIPTPNDQIIVVPVVGKGGGGEKQIMGIIAMVALWYLAPGMAGAFAGMTTGTVAAYNIAYAGIMIGGGLLISSMVAGSVTDDMPQRQDAELTQSFGWSPATTQKQGIPVPLIYGKAGGVTGNAIAVHTEVAEDNKSQTLKTIIALGEGPVKSISNIKINGQPIENFEDVTTESRLGTINQNVISFFTETKAEFRPGMKAVYGSPKVFTTPDSDFDDLEVDVMFPRGIYHANSSSGGLNNHSIGVKVEVREVDGSWFTIGEESVQDNKAGNIWRTYKTSGIITITRGTKYEIRLTKTTTEKSSTKYGDDVQIGGVREVVNDPFSYPNLALVGINALATDQLSGSIDFSCEVEGRIVATYNGTSWGLEYSNNPAWVLYDILTGPIIGGDGTGGDPYAILGYDGIDPSRLDTATFFELAGFCDDIVPDGNGGTEKRVTFNGIIDAQTSRWEAAMKLCRMARCSIVPYGVKYSIAINRKISSAPVQLFTVGNTEEDSFKITYLPEADRASEIEIRYRDQDREYKLTPFTVRNPAIGNASNKISLSMPWITTRSGAWRLGMFLLAQNELIKRTVEFSADIDSIACMIGDVILVQHDIPTWGKGGRVKGGTTNTVQLDQEVVASGGTDEVLIRYSGSDIIQTKEVLSVAGDTITINGTWATIPAKDDVYVFGVQNMNARKYRVAGLERDGDQRCKITAVEYVEAAYDYDDAEPDIAISNVTSPESGSGSNIITASPTWEQIKQRYPDVLIGATMNMDQPLIGNIKFTDDMPDDSSVSWAADDTAEPITILYKGITYEITPSNTSESIIYWKSSAPTALQSTSVLSTIVADDGWVMALNDSGVHERALMQRVINGGLIKAGTLVVDFADITNVAIDFADITNVVIDWADIENVSIGSADISGTLNANHIDANTISGLYVEGKSGVTTSGTKTRTNNWIQDTAVHDLVDTGSWRADCQSYSVVNGLQNAHFNWKFQNTNSLYEGFTVWFVIRNNGYGGSIIYQSAPMHIEPVNANYSPYFGTTINLGAIGKVSGTIYMSLAFQMDAPNSSPYAKLGWSGSYGIDTWGNIALQK